MSANDEPRKLVIAVDFGTTFSALAWAQTRSTRRTTVDRWPDGVGTNSKVPTILQYSSRSGQAIWGFSVDTRLPKYEMFKLGLDPGKEKETALARQYPSVVTLPSSTRDIEDLVVDYLTKLREWLEEVLSSSPASSVLRSLSKQYIITVPAIWSDRAKSRTQTCAERAGMGAGDSIRIISEPEAAAIYVFDEMKAYGFRFKVDDTFVVCDAGGGTVDLISYRVKAIQPVLSVEEAVVGSGHLCGAIFLDRVFARYMRDNFGANREWSEEVLTDALEKFQDVKKRFNGDLDKSYTIPVLIRHDRRGIDQYRLRLTGAQLKNIFDPVVNETVALVRGQIRATTGNVKSVFLVGGFGDNPYLKQRIADVIGNNIELKFPERPVTAVVQGALIKGLADEQPFNSMTRTNIRRARRHYGTETFTEFIPGHHDRNRRKSDAYTGGYRIQVMQWFASKNELIEESSPRPFGYYWDQKVTDGFPGEIKMKIYACEDPNNAGAPTYRDNNVQELGTLRADLSRIPRSELNREPGKDGVMFYKINYDIEMSLRSASLTFALVYKGVKYDSQPFSFS